MQWEPSGKCLAAPVFHAPLYFTPRACIMLTGEDARRACDGLEQALVAGGSTRAAIGFAYTSGRLSGGYAVDYANSL